MGKLIVLPVVLGILIQGAAVFGQSAAPRTANAPAAKHVDLSGTWGTIVSSGRSFQPKGDVKDAGIPEKDGVPYQPWALQKFLSERPAVGPRATFENQTDPNITKCEPIGVPRIWTWPAKVKFIQLDNENTVYILTEIDESWRKVRLNAKHPDDPDEQWWGHSIGHYEGTDTLVVDTVGFNGKQWLDYVGRPTTEKLHVIERFRRIDKNNLELTITIDDPGAYTKPFTYGPKEGAVPLKNDPDVEFGQFPWMCTVDTNASFFDQQQSKTIEPAGKK
jgi:hypothetical protein